MFYKYEIKNNNGENVLYLYINTLYEFSKELISNSDDEELERRTNNFIKNNNIDFNGNKILLVVDGIVVKTFNYNLSNNINLNYNKFIYDDKNYIVILKENDSYVELTLEKILFINLLYFENLEIETMKVLSILFRTYIFKEMEEQKFVDLINAFLPESKINNYNFDCDHNHYIFEKIIEPTNCMFITYDGKYIIPFFHYVSIGRTFSNNTYNYLKSVNSIWDLASPDYINVIDINNEDLSKILNISNINNVNITKINSNFEVEEVSFNNIKFSSDKLINLLNLTSKNFSIIINNNFIRFISRGVGSNIGLSIFGANEMAKNNCNYKSILLYYFNNIILNKYKKELS